MAERILEGLVELRSDLMQFPITYYFREQEANSALPIALAVLLRTIESQPTRSPLTRQIGVALRDTTEYLGRRFLGGRKPPEQAIAEIVTDHGWAREVEKT